MAIIKLSAIVSDIKGSIGAVTFKKQSNSNVAQIKSSGGVKHKLRQNKALFSLSKLVKGWSKLSQAQRDLFDEKTKFYKFPDKFGKLRVLSGRNFYLKLQGNLIPVGFPLMDITSLYPNVEETEIASISIDVSGKKQLFLNDLAQDGYALLSIERVPRSSIKPRYTRRKVLAFVNREFGSEIDFTDAFNARFPLAQKDDIFHVYVVLMNPWGFRSTPINSTVIATDSGSSNSGFVLPPQGVRVLMLTGQSNAEGRGSDADALATELAATNRVKIWNTNVNAFQALDIGSNNKSLAGMHGLELGFLVEYVKTFQDNLYLIKHAVGGAPILEQLPGGSVYDVFFPQYVTEGLIKLKASGLRPFVSYLYFGSENDTVSSALITAFPQKLTELINHYRGLFGLELPFYFFKIFEKNANTIAVNAEYQLRANSSVFVNAVSSDGVGVFDNVHFGYSSLKVLATRFMNLYKSVSPLEFTSFGAGGASPVFVLKDFVKTGTEYLSGLSAYASRAVTDLAITGACALTVHTTDASTLNTMIALTLSGADGVWSAAPKWDFMAYTTSGNTVRVNNSTGQLINPDTPTNIVPSAQETFEIKRDAQNNIKLYVGGQEIHNYGVEIGPLYARFSHGLAGKTVHNPLFS